MQYYTSKLVLLLQLLLLLLGGSSLGAPNVNGNLQEGFATVPLGASNFVVQKPYDVPIDRRYSFINGVHRLWVYSKDKPHTSRSKTNPRTEIRIRGYDYKSGTWQFEGYGYVPRSTSGVSIMQVFGAKPPHATTLMLRTYQGFLTYYRKPVLVQNIYNRWFRLNVIHDADASNVKVYIDGVLVHEAKGRGLGTIPHYFKFGVYAQNDSSVYMESRWKGIEVSRKI